MQKIRVKYLKGRELKFIGHLDLMRTIERTIRRSSISVTFSQGFNPKMKISYGTPLPLGVTSETEFADIEIDGWIKPEDLKIELNAKFPPGINIIEAKIVGPKDVSLMSSTEAIEYVAEEVDTNGLNEKIEKLMKEENMVIKRKRKGITKEVNIRPMIFDISLQGKDLHMIVQSNPNGTVKPFEVMEVLGTEAAEVTRVKQFRKDKGKLIEIQ